MKRFALLVWTLAWAVALVGGVQAQSGSSAVVLTIDGPITPAHSTYLERGLGYAARQNAEVVVLRLNTPGGQLDLMDRLVAQIRGSQVPVVVYVAPGTAMAGSAGTVITLAGHLAAMAPQTTIGAASPIGGQGEDLDTTSETKLKEMLKAQVRSLAAGRPPEAIALAEATIDSARAATAQEAYAAGLVDYIAADVGDLLRQADGATVTVLGRERALATANLAVDDFSMNFVENLLELLTNPNVVFILISIGPLLIIMELSSPGGWVAGFVGVASLLLGLYGLGVLPVNWFGLIFVAVALVLFYMEVHAPTHGGLAVAGTLSLVLGGLVLFNSPGTPSFFRVSVPLVLITSLALAAFFVALVTIALRAQRRPATVGVESLIGQEAVVRTPDSVHVGGELWSAEPAEAGAAGLQPGQRVIVAAVRGLKLLVRRKD